jgi:hypothetical protein
MRCNSVLPWIRLDSVLTDAATDEAVKKLGSGYVLDDPLESRLGSAAK